MGRALFELPSADRTAMVLAAVDANLPVFLVAAHSLARRGNPVAVFLEHPSLLLLVPAFPLAFVLARLYDLRSRWSSPLTLLRVIAASVAAVVPLAVAYGVAARGLAPELRELFGFLALGMAAEVVVVRSLLAARERRRRIVRPALVVGAGWAARAVIDTALREPETRVAVHGVIDDDPAQRNFRHKGVPVVGTAAALREEAERCGARIVITAGAPAGDPALTTALLDLKMRGVEVVDMPSFCERATGQIPIHHVEDSWFVAAGGFELLHHPVMQRVKRGCDVVASLAGLLLSFPLMVVIALLVKLDSRGPVFFRQERTGQGEKPFRVVKFRTMRADAESATGPVWASVRDYRVTRVGRVLRLTRLDELPQFINVLRGEMSFVGPRPERPFFVEKLKREIPHYALRFAVKPGLTGWAQVRYRYGASVEDAIEKLKYDLYYIKNMSLGLDLLIALMTLKVVLFARGN